MYSEIIDNFAGNFLKRDMAALKPVIASDFIWRNAEGEIVAEGGGNFLEMLATIWQEHPKLINKTSSCVEIGNLVSHTEFFEGFTDGHTEEWLWVYEFKGQQIWKMVGYQPTQL